MLYSRRTSCPGVPFIVLKVFPQGITTKKAGSRGHLFFGLRRSWTYCVDGSTNCDGWNARSSVQASASVTNPAEGQPITQYFHEAHTVRSERLATFRGSYGIGSASRYTSGNSRWIAQLPKGGKIQGGFFFPSFHLGVLGTSLSLSFLSFKLFPYMGEGWIEGPPS